MGLSSNAVIHFTDNIEALKGILGNNFKITYCHERILLEDKQIDIMVPMVSFCDMPLSQVKEHIGKYGSYGIGLTKEWAEKQKLNPVLYIEKNSYLSRSIRKVLDTFLGKHETLDKLKEEEKAILDVTRYMKNYQSDLVRANKPTLKDYRFYDEREWRYVLDYTLTNYPVASPDMSKTTLNNSIKNHVLEFEPDDIKYIIIQDESEIKEFLSLLRSAKGKYSHDIVEALMTKIITSKQIKEDF